MCAMIVAPCHNCGKLISRERSVDKRTGKLQDKIFCDRKCYDDFRLLDRKGRANTCRSCGKLIDGPAMGKRKFCNMDCRIELAIKQCLTTCGICGAKFSAIKMSMNGSYKRDKNRKLCSRECLSVFMRTDEDRKLKTAHHRENHPNWQGGTQRRGFRGHDWLKIAERAREKAGRVCEHCGKTEKDNGRKLDVNHKIPFSQFKNKTKANDPSNLEALCRRCHTTQDWKWRKSNSVQLSLGIY